VLLGSWPGRLFLGATLVKLAVAALRLVADVPVFLQLLSSVATLGLAIAVGVFTWRLFAVVRRRLLWRVRRKLILSYIFIGVVPALLIIGFGLLGAGILSMNVSAYLFKDGYDDVVRNAALTADAAAADIARRPGAAGEMLGRVRARAGLDYPGLSLAFVPEAAGLTAAADGPWRHNPVPTRLPDWVRRRPEGYAGTLTGRSPDEPGQVQLIVRAVRPVVSGPTRLGSVVVDVPIDDELVDRLYQQTGVRAGRISVGTESGVEGGSEEDRMALFGRSVAFFDSVDWNTGNTRRATVPMTYRLAELYERLSRAQQAQFRNFPLSYVILLMLAVVAGLFLIIEIVALIMGLALARSITSSVHELFTGTERVRQGDFTHRISISTKDQLGDLADSFNQMTASVENLLQTAAEKKRLEEELRIARQIQMSLLPRGPLEIPGLAVTALCVPAREVGGDYYDFFPLPGDRLGVLIADVAGKGTSAALYMAELKGLVLSLSQIYQSPRQMLLEANRILSENLDSRSFITMTYAVIDLARGTMTYARAGHTPLLYLPRHGPDAGDAQILTPNGMVLGLRIDGAEHKFAELLEEQELTLGVGDVIVLYTDGITEAMNPESDLFGDARLSRIVEQHGDLESGELRERILREIEAFVGGADQHDDMTMILMKVRVREPARLAV
jgi:sigma-B regulation protein RsbU (phosphoserine phosphatase)